MSEQQADKRKYAHYALGAWLSGLAVFVAALVAALAGAPIMPGNDAVKKQVIRAKSDVFDPGCILGILPAKDSIEVPTPKFAAGNEYVLMGFGLQGFYQAFPDGFAWQIDLPGKVLEAQLIRRGSMPKVITQDAKLSWELITAAEAEAAADGVRFAASSGEMTPNDKTRSFSATIEASPYLEKSGKFNPYRLIKIKAQDAASGEALAESAAVLAVSPGFGCAHCHADAEYGIPALHDKAKGTDLEARARGGGQIYCKSCHMDLTVEGGEFQPGLILSFSAAIHGWHAPFFKDREADACLTCHIGLGRQPAEPGKEDGWRQATRPQALFMRGLHLTRGLSCVNCHGHMEDHALALLQAENEAGQEYAADAMRRVSPRAVSAASEIKPRLAWAQEPDCAGCHDYKSKPQIAKASGFNRWTDLPDGSGRPKLFSARADYGGTVRCATCHGAPHALYAARNPISEDLDNIQPMQYQEAAAPVGSYGNCAVCHTRTMRMPPVHHPFVEVSSTEISMPAGVELMMPPVRFPHEMHTPLVDCGICHHTGHVDGQPLACVSSGCHDAADAGDAPEGRDYRYFQQAFHGATPSCNACHEARRESGEPAGPTDCAGCHRAPSSLWNEE